MNNIAFYFNRRNQVDNKDFKYWSTCPECHGTHLASSLSDSASSGLLWGLLIGAAINQFISPLKVNHDKINQCKFWFFRSIIYISSIIPCLIIKLLSELYFILGDEKHEGYNPIIVFTIDYFLCILVGISSFSIAQYLLLKGGYEIFEVDYINSLNQNEKEAEKIQAKTTDDVEFSQINNQDLSEGVTAKKTPLEYGSNFDEFKNINNRDPQA